MRIKSNSNIPIIQSLTYFRKLPYLSRLLLQIMSQPNQSFKWKSVVMNVWRSWDPCPIHQVIISILVGRHLNCIDGLSASPCQNKTCWISWAAIWKRHIKIEQKLIKVHWTGWLMPHLHLSEDMPISCRRKDFSPSKEQSCNLNLSGWYSFGYWKNALIQTFITLLCHGMVGSGEGYIFCWDDSSSVAFITPWLNWGMTACKLTNKTMSFKNY